MRARGQGLLLAGCLLLLGPGCTVDEVVGALDSLDEDGGTRVDAGRRRDGGSSDDDGGDDDDDGRRRDSAGRRRERRSHHDDGDTDDDGGEDSLLVPLLSVPGDAGRP